MNFPKFEKSKRNRQTGFVSICVGVSMIIGTLSNSPVGQDFYTWYVLFFSCVVVILGVILILMPRNNKD